MEANELRINNKIYWKSRRSDVAINDRKDFNIVLESLENGEDEFQPIDLTEDWLKKFGFEKTSNNEHTKDRFVIRKQQRDLVINGFENDYNGILLTRPEYVHTLQNLYFALMGEELTLKN